MPVHEEPHHGPNAPAAAAPGLPLSFSSAKRLLDGPVIPERRKRQLLRAMREAVAWGRRRLPPGVRSVAGLGFVLGGVFGFLPILGFWMIPIGLVLIATDIPAVRRRLSRWLRQHDRRRPK